MDDFKSAPVPNRVSLCYDAREPTIVEAEHGRVYNLTFPGTPPFKVHSAIQAKNGTVGCNLNILEGNLTTNTFAWSTTARGDLITPEFHSLTPAENGAYYNASMYTNGTIVWYAQETQGNISDARAANTVWISASFQFGDVDVESSASARTSPHWLQQAVVVITACTVLASAMTF